MIHWRTLELPVNTVAREPCFAPVSEVKHGNYVSDVALTVYFLWVVSFIFDNSRHIFHLPISFSNQMWDAGMKK